MQMQVHGFNETDKGKNPVKKELKKRESGKESGDQHTGCHE